MANKKTVAICAEETTGNNQRTKVVQQQPGEINVPDIKIRNGLSAVGVIRQLKDEGCMS